MPTIQNHKVTKTQTSSTDLTQRPPRSFRVRLGNYVILARMLDKGRATLARKNGKYKYNSTTDQRLVQFLGFDPDAMLKELAAGKGDGEILEWVQSHSKTPRAPWEIKRPGGKAITIQREAADAAAVKAAVEKTVATFGRLDVLVNNAGTAIPKKFEEATLEEMDRVIDINVRGVFVATQAALKHMRDGGRIIMIGSSVGERVGAPGLVPYAATKGAGKIFTQGLAREVGSRGITVK